MAEERRAVGGWYLYIIAKGSGVDESKVLAIFNAGTLTGEKLVWGQEHLVESHYDGAHVNHFRTDGSDYLSEIRVGPRFRPKD